MDLFYSESSASDETHGAGTGEPGMASASEPPQPSAGAQIVAAPLTESSLLVPPVRDVAIDTAGWQHQLERLGFSHREAASLIFERVRPRGEGLVRN